jgi:ParB-like chromosome segregation protein Spo0J
MSLHHTVLMIPTWDLKPYENNARTHSPEQVEQLTKSIKQFGFNNPILVQEDLTVVAGHGRLMAAKKLGLESVPVIKLRHLTQEQVKAYVLADNKLALNAGWDDEILKAELLAIQEAGEIDMDAIGFSDDEMKALIDGVDVEEEQPRDRPEYSKKIDTPAYTPKGDKPELETLVDKTKASELIKKIYESEVSEDEKKFLLAAAQRHNVFNYHLIAEYYCHATPAMQDLMEQSALVIIDLNKAIEGGYVTLSKRLQEIYSDSYSPDSDDEA